MPRSYRAAGTHALTPASQRSHLPSRNDLNSYAMAWVLFVIIVAVTLIQLRVSKRLVYLEGDQR